MYHSVSPSHFLRKPYYHFVTDSWDEVLSKRGDYSCVCLQRHDEQIFQLYLESYHYLLLYRRIHFQLPCETMLDQVSALRANTIPSKCAYRLAASVNRVIQTRN